MAITTTHICSWGIDHDNHTTAKFVGTGSGIVYDVNKNIDPIQAPEHNEIGQVIAQTVYDEHQTMTATLQTTHGVTPPTRGSTVQIDNEYWYMVNCTKTESNQAYVRYNITLERFFRIGQNSVVLATGAFAS